MNLSLNWLNDYVKTDSIPLPELIAGLTMSGSKVEKYKKLSDPLDKVVIGKVSEIKKHENSDKLWICKVEVGAAAPVQVVTGAQNVFEGAIVPVVLDGGTVLNRQDGSAVKIKKGKLRGEVSEGMLCSPDELGLSKSELPYADEDGILILSKDPEADKLVIGQKIGTSALDFLGLNDTAIEFEITNNRPDCLSVLGLARETAATFGLPLKDENIERPAYTGFKSNIEKEIDVVIENKRLCSRYMAGLARNVKIGPSPKWLASRLKASGVRPINNIVDITNYVMLEYGHPMHAFDKRFIEGGQIVVRSAFAGERITLLDGNTVELSPDILVIADRMKPIAVAGVMGGEYSGVMPDTATVIFESACFDGYAVRMASKKIGRRTESSARFEKGLDPVNAKAALLRALRLVEILGCGEVADTFIDYVNFEEEVKKVAFDPKAINALLGAEIPESEQTAILKKLGFGVEDGFVTVPPWRTDIELTCDLAEEVARIYGYNNIKSTLPRLSAGLSESRADGCERNIRKLVNILTARGCRECITYSFVPPDFNGGIAAFDSPVKIRNPFGAETSEMRTSLIPSMLKVIADNQTARVTEARFFEIGRKYAPGKETDTLAIGLYGKNEDFYTLKGIIEDIGEAFGMGGIGGTGKSFERYTEKPFHPGRAAVCEYGVFGEVLPQENIQNRAYIAEIDLEKLFSAAKNAAVYTPIPKFPAVTRDLSLVCPEETANGVVLEIIGKSGGTLLESAEFFDIFKGGSLKDGYKCMSYSLVFRGKDGTLTDADADAAVTKILAALKREDIVLR